MSDDKTPPETTTAPRRSSLVPMRTEGLPAVLPPSPPPPRPRRRLGWIVLLVGIVAAAGGGAYWWQHSGSPIPPGIVWSNGRLEADEIDIATKFPGRIAEIRADEGDMVKAGQVLAVMDTRDLQASLQQAEAQIDAARHTVTATQAELAQQAAQLKLAALELQRIRPLVPHGFETRERLDQRQAQFDAAQATFRASQAKLENAKATLSAATHSAEIIEVNIADNTLVAPKTGPILYRLANVGEVLGAGGKVFTMLDVGYVYMDIFLPTADADRVRLGADARILLDAAPDRPIPAQVNFLSPQNQFTPKTVETRSERDKLMFRVRVRIAPERSRAHAAQVRSGLPGIAYIRTDPAVPWPDFLQRKEPG